MTTVLEGVAAGLRLVGAEWHSRQDPAAERRRPLFFGAKLEQDASLLSERTIGPIRFLAHEALLEIRRERLAPVRTLALASLIEPASGRSNASRTAGTWRP